MQYQIDITGLKEMIARLNALTKEKTIKDAVHLGARFVRGTVVDTRLSGPRPNVLGRRSGRLASSITAGQTEKNDNVYTAKIGTNVKYARVHEYGAVIKPKNKPFLAWQDYNTKKWIFTRKPVVIPARPIFKHIFESNYVNKTVLNIVTKQLNEALSKP